MEFHDIIKSAALEFAKKNAIAISGEIVGTNQGWKKPHKVMISHVGAALACGDFNREVWEFHAELVMTYYAFKLDKNGEPKTEPGGCIVLSAFGGFVTRKHVQKLVRLDKANELIRVIANCGRRFFWCDRKQRYAEIQVDERGRCWWVDDYTGKRVYLHTAGYAQWSGFSHGGTLRSLVEAIRDYISRGELISAGHFGPWAETFCGGDLWGYGKESMEIIRRAADRLLIVSH